MCADGVLQGVSPGEMLSAIASLTGVASWIYIQSYGSRRAGKVGAGAVEKRSISK